MLRMRLDTLKVSTHGLVFGSGRPMVELVLPLVPELGRGHLDTSELRERLPQMGHSGKRLTVPWLLHLDLDDFRGVISKYIHNLDGYFVFTGAVISVRGRNK